MAEMEKSGVRRIMDKYRGKKFSDLEGDQQAEFLEAIASRGAQNALKSIGLNDENALRDMNDLREALNGYRTAKVVVRSGIVSFLKQGWDVVKKVMTIAFFIYLMAKIGLDSKHIKQASDILGIAP